MNFFEPRVLKDPDLQPTLEQPIGLQLRVELRDTEPRVWRTIEIPTDLYLDEFHMVLQGAMGWQHSHLHSFSDGSGDYKAFVADYEIAVADEVDTIIAQEDYRVDQLIQQVGDRLVYAYDYGDGWEHEVVVEQVLNQPPATPRCTGGAQTCPPEDCGGPFRANELAAWVRAGYDNRFEAEEHELFRQWLGEWSPDDFTVDAANEHLRFMLARHVRVVPELRDILANLPSRRGELIREALTEPVWQQHDDAPELTHTQIEPFLTLFDLIADGAKLTAAKYLPPAVVKEWTSRLNVDTTMYSATRELDSPLMHVRDLARDLGLVHVRSGVIKPTKKAGQLGSDGVKWARHLADKVPLGKGDYERHAGFALLVAIGSGTPFKQWTDISQEFLTDFGWQTSGGGPANPYTENYFALRLFAEGPKGIPWDQAQIVQHTSNLAVLARSVVRAPR